MPSPKSGNAPPAVAPAEPKEAYDADDANPGAMDEVKAGQKESKTGKYGEPASGAPHKPPASQEEREEKISWIEIEMVDQEDKPVVGMPYRITLPDGTTFAEGTLDEKGFARVDYIEPGNCKVTFPTLDQEAWEEL